MSDRDHQKVLKDVDKGHRWSGWPGAFCLNCFAEDQRENCLADHGVATYCKAGHDMCDDLVKHGGFYECPSHQNQPCPEPIR